MAALGFCSLMLLHHLPLPCSWVLEAEGGKWPAQKQQSLAVKGEARWALAGRLQAKIRAPVPHPAATAETTHVLEISSWLSGLTRPKPVEKRLATLAGFENRVPHARNKQPSSVPSFLYAIDRLFF